MVAFGGIKNKLPYEQLETQRFIRRHGITNSSSIRSFPVNTLDADARAVAARTRASCRATSTRCSTHMWERAAEDGRSGGHHGRARRMRASTAARLLERAQTPEVKAAPDRQHRATPWRAAPSASRPSSSARRSSSARTACATWRSDNVARPRVATWPPDLHGHFHGRAPARPLFSGPDSVASIRRHDSHVSRGKASMNRR